MEGSPHSDQESEPDELVRFREAWKAEVQQKHTLRDPGPTRRDERGPSNEQVADLPTLPSLGLPALNSAVEIYREAVDLEQRSQLDDALRLYRRAFRMDPNVDKAFHRLEKLATIAQVTVHNSTPATVEKLPRRFTTVVPVKPGRAAGTGMLASLLATFPSKLVFERENEKEPLPLDTIPDEVLVLILRKLDHSTLERFACISRKARMLSLDSVIWKDLVEMTYKPPQISNETPIDKIVDKYLWDYRRVYVEHPRLRMDGVYIAACHYVRQGLSMDAWVNISQLITYHRYLRFFANGQVLSLLANEERTPQEIIPLLNPTLRMKGLSIGTWHLEATDVHITNLLDVSYLPFPTTPFPSDPSFSPPSSSTTATTTSLPRYLFQMTLILRSRPLGRWNKLELLTYESVAVETGEVCALGLKHERPFWFSKVRSWV